MRLGTPIKRLRRASDALVVIGLVFGACLLAIKSAWLSGGTLVVWPADGLIVGLMLARRTSRPWLVMAAGLIGALLAFCSVGRQMVLGVSRVGLMAVAIPIVYQCIRPIVRSRSIAEARVLLPFLAVCGAISLATAFLRSLILHVGWGFPVGQLAMTATTATFAGYAIITPLVLLLAQSPVDRSRTLRSQAMMWGVVALYAAALTAAFLEPRYPVAYLVPVALILVAHVVDFNAILVAILATAAISVGLTFSGHGAISHFPGDLREKILLTQAFLAVVICSTLPFSAMRSDGERLHRSVAAALEEAKSASQAKSIFLATISHEIRTPLNGLLGMAQAMELDELTSAQRKRLAVLHSSGNSLLSLLNDVLDLSKIEAGKMALEAIPFDPAEVIVAIIDQNRALAASKGLTIEAETIGLDSLYDGDPNRIRQIVQNLVSNAIKFTSAGGVVIIGKSGDAGLTIQVRDTGMGIPSASLAILFEKFRQVDDTTTRRFGGTGLGLSICRELAQAMGGDVTVESVEGAGSTFTVFAPLPRSTTAPVGVASPPGDEAPPQLGLRVLAAEDNPTNQLVLRALLGAAGIEPTVVDNGADAIAAWRGAVWDVILMDVQMPVMDGLTATKQIRLEEAASTRDRTPIVALTANVMDYQQQSYLESGMDDCLAKPIELQKLFALLEDVECKRRAFEQSGKSPGLEGFRSAIA